ncbi:MAG: hypothetical protein FD123_2252 [Bacteroidetes bacterium]|nr:MAG: hypothetical protein FD123_2252 [Bacteroidota bacterium]
MKKTNIFFVTLFSGIFTTASFAQVDFHLAQYDMAPLYLNPALTGMFCGEKGDYRVTSNYRSQWRSLGYKPFSTIALGYDMPLEKYKDKWGVGGYIVSNKSGAGNFHTLNFMSSGAYNIMDGTNKHYLTAGLQMGLLYKSFDPASYTYDVQYSQSSGTFDTSIPNEEASTLEKTNLLRFDANLGIYYKYRDVNKKFSPSAGFSVYHLTKPNEAFSGNKSQLPMRFVLHTACDFKINDDFTVTPRILYMNQAKAYEANFGALLFYKIKNSTLDAIAGVDYRHKDAIIAHIGFRQEQHYFRFSYDINTSYLDNYTSGRGAWEFSLILVGIKSQPLFKPVSQH